MSVTVQCTVACQYCGVFSNLTRLGQKFKISRAMCYFYNFLNLPVSVSKISVSSF